jgi:hypothetical protein
MGRSTWWIPIKYSFNWPGNCKFNTVILFYCSTILVFLEFFLVIFIMWVNIEWTDLFIEKDLTYDLTLFGDFGFFFLVTNFKTSKKTNKLQLVILLWKHDQSQFFTSICHPNSKTFYYWKNFIFYYFFKQCFCFHFVESNE